MPGTHGEQSGASGTMTDQRLQDIGAAPKPTDACSPGRTVLSPILLEGPGNGAGTVSQNSLHQTTRMFTGPQGCHHGSPTRNQAPGSGRQKIRRTPGPCQAVCGVRPGLGEQGQSAAVVVAEQRRGLLPGLRVSGVRSSVALSVFTSFYKVFHQKKKKKKLKEK